MANLRTVVLRHGWNATVYRALDSDLKQRGARAGGARPDAALLAGLFSANA